MKAQISHTGHLFIERAGAMKAQFCPSRPGLPTAGPYECGDWCPLFDESVVRTYNTNNGCPYGEPVSETTSLHLCCSPSGGYFNAVEDLREKK